MDPGIQFALTDERGCVNYAIILSFKKYYQQFHYFVRTNFSIGTLRAAFIVKALKNNETVYN